MLGFKIGGWCALKVNEEGDLSAAAWCQLSCIHSVIHSKDNIGISITN